MRAFHDHSASSCDLERPSRLVGVFPSRGPTVDNNYPKCQRCLRGVCHRTNIKMFLTSSIASICLLASLLCSLTSGAVARSTADWKSRSIYQIMTDRFARTDGSTSAPCDTWAGMYCGGSWQGIINQLDYIQGMGFTAIQISPVTENLPQTTRFGQAYHGYWPQDIFSTNDNFGSRDDLVALSQELHKRGMYFMVDVVINDMAYSTPNGNQTDIDYSVFQPFNDPKYYHPYCNITDYANYTDAQVRRASFLMHSPLTYHRRYAGLGTGGFLCLT